MDNDDAFIIIETTPKPRPAAQPNPLIVEEPGRTFGDLTPQQKSRTVRSQHGPFYFEPIYVISGPTGRWRVGRIAGSTEETISEFANKEEAMVCFGRLVTEFFGRG